MKDWILKIFTNGSEVSSMRVMAMISLLTGCYIGIAGLYQNKNLAELSILCGTFLGASMGGKILQKNAEIKEVKNADV